MNIFIQVHTSPFIFLADKLHAQGLKPTVIECTPQVRPDMRRKFPDAVPVNLYEQFLNWNWIAKQAVECHLSGDDRALLDHEYPILMHLLSRTMNQQKLYQIDKDWCIASLARYIKHLILNHDLQAAIFSAEPHQLHDYLMFRFMRLYGRRTYLSQKTAVRGCSILRFGIEAEGDSFRPQYDDTRKDRIGQTIDEHFAEKLGDEQVLPAALKLKREIHAEPKKQSYFAPYISMYSQFYDLVARSTLFELLDIVMGKSAISPYQWTYPVESALRRLQTEAAFRKCQSDEPPAPPYILVALQCQPERQIVPCGGRFYNQLNLVDLAFELRDALELSAETSVVVKEHPSQLSNYQRSYLGRSEHFYESLRDRPGVTLINNEYDAFRLVDECLFSVGTSGSIGWETILRGKPHVYAGYPWYKDLAPQCNAELLLADEDARVRFQAALQQADKADLDTIRQQLLAQVIEFESDPLFQRRLTRDEQIEQGDNLATAITTSMGMTS